MFEELEIGDRFVSRSDIAKYIKDGKRNPVECYIKVSRSRGPLACNAVSMAGWQLDFENTYKVIKISK